jgi:primosomal protein N'
VTTAQVFDYWLFLIQCQLSFENRKSLTNAGLPSPQMDWSVQLGNPYLQQHMQYDHAQQSQQFEQCIPLLNAEQEHAFSNILPAILSGIGGPFFVKGTTGAGKTFFTVYSILDFAVKVKLSYVLCPLA